MGFALAANELPISTNDEFSNWVKPNQEPKRTLEPEG